MFFEQFLWEEEKLGLISGLSFVLIGVFGYLIYLQNLSLISILFLVFAMVFAGATAALFQLPRIRGSRAAVSTFLGGIAIGISVIFWVIADVGTSTDWVGELIIFSLTAIELVLAFFAIGFMLLALYPAGSETAAPATQNVEKGTETHEHKVEDDIFERL